VADDAALDGGGVSEDPVGQKSVRIREERRGAENEGERVEK
jgi:hypothetical protein